MANDDGGPLWAKSGEDEISLLKVRDCFAALAMVGLLMRKDAYPYRNLEDDQTAVETARVAYLVADRMLAERAKPKDQT